MGFSPHSSHLNPVSEGKHHFGLFSLPSDNGFWDVIRTTTTKQPKTTRAPPKRNPGEQHLHSPCCFTPAQLLAQGEDLGCAMMVALPSPWYFLPLVCWNHREDRESEHYPAFPGDLGGFWTLFHSHPCWKAVRLCSYHGTALLGSTGTHPQAQGTLSAGHFAACPGRALV